jgi:hypothetical protein
LGLPDDADHVNATGGAIALGHRLGMSGGRLVMTAAHQLQKSGGKLALACMCSVDKHGGDAGTALSEAVSVALPSRMGRVAAHDLLRRAADRALAENHRLSDVLKQMPEVKAHLSDAEIDELLDASNYLGSAQRFISRVVGEQDAHD